MPAAFIPQAHLVGTESVGPFFLIGVLSFVKQHSRLAIVRSAPFRVGSNSLSMPEIELVKKGSFALPIGHKSPQIMISIELEFYSSGILLFNLTIGDCINQLVDSAIGPF